MAVTMTTPDIRSDDYYDQIYEVGDATPTSVIARILKQCCNALNHEDENYIPAIKQAIKRLEAQS